MNETTNPKGLFYSSFFLHTFDKRKGHNMLVLTLDPRFKTMKLITMFMGHEYATLMVAKYDENLLLHLLMESNKFLMPNKVKATCNLHSKGDFEGLFTLH